MPDAASELGFPGPGARTPGPFVLVIFGASGDLVRRKLLPAVYSLFRDGLLPEGFAVLGYGRTPMSDAAFRREMARALAPLRRRGRGARWRAFAARLHYQRGGYGDPEGYRALGRRLEALAAGPGGPASRLFYLATPPAVFVPVVDALRASGLARRGCCEAPWARIVVEKPFGRDLASARDLGACLRRAFQERQIFRIDHYLGKETVQNLLVLRFANAIFEPLWNRKYVDHVQVAVSETAGVEGRGAYYDGAGALRDIVQNHMMHLVSLVAMEPPRTLRADAVRDEKVRVLRALRRMAPACVPQDVVRAQYAAGTVGGRRVRGYRAEPGVARGSATETFVALKAFIDNRRWAGVPFYLRSGKRLPARVTEIGVHFRPVGPVLFGAGSARALEPNVLAIRIQPNEGISMRFQVKVPGPAMRIEPFQMDFGYAEAFRRRPPDAYERLLLDAALGDSTLFTRRDEVEAAWTYLDPILRACAERPPQRLPAYRAGTWGPAEADALIEADGRRWTLLRRPKRGPKA